MGHFKGFGAKISKQQQLTSKAWTLYSAPTFLQ